MEADAALEQEQARRQRIQDELNNLQWRSVIELQLAQARSEVAAAQAKLAALHARVLPPVDTPNKPPVSTTAKHTSGKHTTGKHTTGKHAAGKISGRPAGSAGAGGGGGVAGKGKGKSGGKQVSGSAERRRRLVLHRLSSGGLDDDASGAPSPCSGCSC